MRPHCPSGHVNFSKIVTYKFLCHFVSTKLRPAFLVVRHPPTTTIGAMPASSYCSLKPYPTTATLICYHCRGHWISAPSPSTVSLFRHVTCAPVTVCCSASATSNSSSDSKIRTPVQQMGVNLKKYSCKLIRHHVNTLIENKENKNFE